MATRSGIKVAEAAEIIGATAQYVRVAMQMGILNIGTCLKMPHSKIYTYNISPRLLADYSGKDVDKELDRIRSGKAAS